MADPRLGEAIRLFNAAEWYGCHDGFEELWHESVGPMRLVLQGILQLAVAQLHLQRDNRRGATILTGEGLGRLESAPGEALGLNLEALRTTARLWLAALQHDQPVDALPALRLEPAGGGQRDL